MKPLGFNQDYASAQNLKVGDYISVFRISYVKRLDSLVQVSLEYNGEPKVVQFGKDDLVGILRPIYPICSRGHDIRG